VGRYDDVPVVETTVPGPDGPRPVRHLGRRTLPDPGGLRVLAWHRVAADDRLDLVAARHLGDPTAFWRIADANAALDPDALVGPDAEGDVLLVPVPEV